MATYQCVCIPVYTYIYIYIHVYRYVYCKQGNYSGPRSCVLRAPPAPEVLLSRTRGAGGLSGSGASARWILWPFLRWLLGEGFASVVHVDVGVKTLGWTRAHRCAHMYMFIFTHTHVCVGVCVCMSCSVM